MSRNIFSNMQSFFHYEYRIYIYIYIYILYGFPLHSFDIHKVEEKLLFKNFNMLSLSITFQIHNHIYIFIRILF